MTNLAEQETIQRAIQYGRRSLWIALGLLPGLLLIYAVRTHPSPSQEALEDARLQAQITALAGEVADPHSYLVLRDGVRLFYRHWEPPSGRAVEGVVVSIHGSGSHGAHHQVLGRHLTPQGMAVYALDMRGHGFSGGRRGDLDDFGTFVADVDEVLWFLRQKHRRMPIFLLGESMGGSIAMRYAAEHPDGMAGIVLLAPAYRLALSSARSPGPLAILRGLLYPVYALCNPQARVIDLSGGRGEPGQEEDILITRRMSLRLGLTLFRTMRTMRDLAPSVTIPTLILHGGQDRSIDPQGSRELYERLASRDKELILFPEAHHILLRDPETPRVLATIERWLGERELRRWRS
ncbi:MAG TPA: alpha/beta hydrolase [Anaerolineae bacterium]|nr:alpha/beta hydrolase [Anaerolineae bacterium]